MATRTKALPATGSPEPHTTARDTTRPARTRTRTGKDRDCMDRDRVDLDPDHKLDPSLAPAALPPANAPGHPLPPAPTRGSEDFPGIGDGEVVTDRRPRIVGDRQFDPRLDLPLPSDDAHSPRPSRRHRERMARRLGDLAHLSGVETLRGCQIVASGLSATPRQDLPILHDWLRPVDGQGQAGQAVDVTSSRPTAPELSTDEVERQIAAVYWDALCVRSGLRPAATGERPSTSPTAEPPADDAPRRRRTLHARQPAAHARTDEGESYAPVSKAEVEKSMRRLQRQLQSANVPWDTSPVNVVLVANRAGHKGWVEGRTAPRDRTLERAPVDVASRNGEARRDTTEAVRGAPVASVGHCVASHDPASGTLLLHLISIHLTPTPNGSLERREVVRSWRIPAAPSPSHPGPDSFDRIAKVLDMVFARVGPRG